ncbi:Demethylphylloquinone reductase NdbB [BD1-7 clade bacterium]|uniref:Demethylphylloquinone reductase NdbB n=1 Tax=BD1-7 clade bacterium TaxID=2029982 RepID=A0A5S9NTS4_9GAMM|nr:Demethylphylloquinone reductase NdbB [BD1-7 clade bacterium]CAA0093919.1 Demethylphylloquinone reductase NdbB [BD1-7 clade bacterium]
MKKRIIIAGFGDTGLLVAVHLKKHYDIIGISAKPCLVSGQELGTRLTQPETWKQNYLMRFGRYRHLDGVKTLHGTIETVDAHTQAVTVKLVDGSTVVETYDILVIASGVTNGFWRNNRLQSLDDIESGLTQAASQLSNADKVAIIGGGATGVSVASNLKELHPGKRVHLFYSQSHPLPGYHPRVRNRIEQRLKTQGVQLHPYHRAEIPDGFACEDFTDSPLEWSSGQPTFHADLTLWAVGKLTPNSDFVPQDMLNEKGFVNADEYLRVPGYENVFTVGDIAASDPNRSSARNAGFMTVAHNITAVLEGKPKTMKRFKATRFRWGSILGVQKEGMRVFTPQGFSVRVPRSIVKTVLFPFFVRRVIYRGVKAGT